MSSHFKNLVENQQIQPKQIYKMLNVDDAFHEADIVYELYKMGVFKID